MVYHRLSIMSHVFGALSENPPKLQDIIESLWETMGNLHENHGYTAPPYGQTAMAVWKGPLKILVEGFFVFTVACGFCFMLFSCIPIHIQSFRAGLILIGSCEKILKLVIVQTENQASPLSTLNSVDVEISTTSYCVQAVMAPTAAWIQWCSWTVTVSNRKQ